MAGRATSVAEVIKADLDAAFVHAATVAHPEIVEALLSAGVHVYVDKPIADNLADCERLARMAREERRSLMVGFNRRHAPGYAELARLPRHLVLMEKNRRENPDVARRVVFDDFIHVVDTLRFLAPGPVTGTRFRTRTGDGLLEHIVLELSGDGFTAIGVMNRASGASEESCEVMGGGVKRRVVNLGDVIDYAGGEVAHPAPRLGAGRPAARHRADLPGVPRRGPRRPPDRRRRRAGQPRHLRGDRQGELACLSRMARSASWYIRVKDLPPSRVTTVKPLASFSGLEEETTPATS